MPLEISQFCGNWKVQLVPDSFMESDPRKLQTFSTKAPHLLGESESYLWETWHRKKDSKFLVTADSVRAWCMLPWKAVAEVNQCHRTLHHFLTLLFVFFPAWVTWVVIPGLHASKTLCNVVVTVMQLVEALCVYCITLSLHKIKYLYFK